ncbi:MAG: hypothetical protein NZM35_03015 [Chitinophagales bacterium]|nr:hypothetical protein [Chitinophagales bacterium]MDW8418311.1 hypothetical protein [Chitinophagales bacterium]
MRGLLFITAFITLMSITEMVYAQPGGGGGGVGQGGPPPPVPVDGGVILLVAAAAAYGRKVLKQQPA